ncbi:TolC family protein [Myxococcota bacterium]|nr:TolC family protein [Myxococcota bacterium]
MEDALLRRPELRVQDSLRKAARLQVDSAGLRALPTLSATFGWSASSVDFVTGESTAWRLSLDLSWTLYDGGFRYGRLRQARAQARAAEAALRDQRVQVSRQVRDALADLGVSRERLVLAEKQRALAEEADRTARRGFENGVVSSLDALDASTRLFQADVGLEDARARVGRAAAALRQARGVGQR